jgi:hypothetical protein
MGQSTLLVMAGRSKSLGQPSQPTYLGYPHLETETDQVRSNNEKHQVVVADYHAEVFTEFADHGPDDSGRVRDQQRLKEKQQSRAG